MPGWWLVLGVLLGVDVRASCPEPASLDDVRARTRAVDEALRAGQNLEARDEARRLRDALLPCLVTPLPGPSEAASIARAIGAGYVAAGELALGKPWLRTAIDLETFAWPLPDDHPVVEVWRQLVQDPSPEPVRAAGDRFVAVARLDGVPIEVPAARPDRPHLLQLGDGPVTTFVMFGGLFPSDALGDGERRRRRSQVAEAPRSIDDPRVVDRLRPPEKTPLLVSGAALVVVAGGLYALAAQRRQRFEDPLAATTLDELTGLRNQVNGLVIASAATLALGVSGATWGSMVDARGTTTLRVRF